MTAVDPSLVTIETVERLIGKAYDLIDEGKTTQAASVLQAARDETTRRTVSAVKDQDTSDEIARVAAQRVRLIMAEVVAERAPLVVSVAVGRHYNGELIGVIRALQEVRQATGMSLAEATRLVRAEYAGRGLTYPKVQPVAQPHPQWST